MSDPQTCMGRLEHHPILVPCPEVASWMIDHPDNTTSASCDRHLAELLYWDGINLVYMRDTHVE